MTYGKKNEHISTYIIINDVTCNDIIILDDFAGQVAEGWGIGAFARASLCSGGILD